MGDLAISVSINKQQRGPRYCVAQVGETCLKDATVKVG